MSELLSLTDWKIFTFLSQKSLVFFTCKNVKPVFTNTEFQLIGFSSLIRPFTLTVCTRKWCDILMYSWGCRSTATWLSQLQTAHCFLRPAAHILQVGGWCLCSPLCLNAADIFQIILWKVVQLERHGEWALQRHRADSYIATLLFCPAALCPLCLPRAGASVCLLATSSSCKLEESPERGTKGAEKRQAGEKQWGWEVSNWHNEESTGICCCGYYSSLMLI